MSDGLRVHCPECNTVVYKDTPEEAGKTAVEHEELHHGGESTVRVNGISLPSFSDEQRQQVQEIIEGFKQ